MKTETELAALRNRLTVEGRMISILSTTCLVPELLAQLPVMMVQYAELSKEYDAALLDTMPAPAFDPLP